MSLKNLPEREDEADHRGQECVLLPILVTIRVFSLEKVNIIHGDSFITTDLELSQAAFRTTKDVSYGHNLFGDCCNFFTILRMFLTLE